LIVLFKEKPPTPPSSTTTEVTGDLCTNIKKVIKEKNFVIMTLAYGMIIGSVNTYGTITGLICEDFKFSLNAASLFGAVFIFGGIVGSAIFGTIVEIKKNYKLVM
jgi:hypothetical protein